MKWKRGRKAVTESKPKSSADKAKPEHDGKMHGAFENEHRTASITAGSATDCRRPKTPVADNTTDCYRHAGSPVESRAASVIRGDKTGNSNNLYNSMTLSKCGANGGHVANSSAAIAI